MEGEDVVFLRSFALLSATFAQSRGKERSASV